MNIFTHHPRDHGFGYREHFGFAMRIAGRLFQSVLAFAAHAILPFLPIEPQLDLEATAAFLQLMNRLVTTRTIKRRGTTPSGSAMRTVR